MATQQVKDGPYRWKYNGDSVFLEIKGGEVSETGSYASYPLHKLTVGTLTPLIAATPERIKALEYVLHYAGIGVGHDQYDSDLQTIKTMLAEMKGGDDGNAK